MLDLTVKFAFVREMILVKNQKQFRQNNKCHITLDLGIYSLENLAWKYNWKSLLS